MKNPQRKDILKNIGYSFVETMGVYCLAEKKDNILMWSHYAANHTGFCMEFKTDCPFFGRAQKMIYKKEYPIFNFFRASQARITEATLLTKAINWEYEQEWRIIEPENGVGCKIYPKNSLVGIILGCRILEENKKLLLHYISEYMTELKVYQAKLSKSDFALEIEPL